MNILFLTIGRFVDVEQKGIYTDLMRKFRNKGHNVYVVSPLERRYKEITNLRENKGIHILGVKTLNMQKCSFIEKGIGILLVEYQFKHDIKKFLKDVDFDLVMYSTPPITFTKAVKYVKKHFNATSYLLLKDIFPQNAVDINLIKKNSILHKFFIKKEQQLYKISDYIGCMSPANVEYLLSNNKYLKKELIEVNPNSIEVLPIEDVNKIVIRNKYNLPTDKTIFIYGGNIGKPQAIDFIIQCLDKNKDREDCFFIIVGSGTEYYTISKWIENIKPNNVKLIDFLPTEQYNELLTGCDVGMVFLDYRFTIPNYPSRLLSYLNNKLPVLVVTDVNSDMGKIAMENNFGAWCPSNDVNAFTNAIDNYLNNYDIKLMGENGYNFLLDNYTVDKSYQIIMNHFNK